MSVDIFLTLDIISFVMAGAILTFGAYRALQFRKAFNNEIFRDRALWTAAVLAAWIVPNDTQILFTDLPPPSGWDIPAALDLVTVALAIVLIIVVAVFIDRNVRAARDLDFFHRDTLNWRRLRLVVLVGAPLSLVVNLLVGFVLGNQVIWDITDVLLPATLIYGVAALLVAGHRVYNQPVKKYLRLMGIGFALLVATIPVSVPVLYDIILLLGSYFLYLSAASLYSLRGIDKARL